MPSKQPARTRKPPQKKQPTSPSLISLFSSITKISTNSSGSNSTVTQESHARNSRSPRHAPSTPKQAPASKKPALKPAQPPTPSDSEAEGRPNVFAFMEDDEDDDSSDGESSQEEDSEDQDGGASDEESEESDDESVEERAPVTRKTPPVPVPTNLKTRPQPSPKAVSTPPGRSASDSFHSDSGISIRSNSPDRKRPMEQRKQAEPNVRRPMRPRQLDLDSSPEAFYKRTTRSVPHTATFPTPAPAPALSQSLVKIQQGQALTQKLKSTSHIKADVAARLSATSQSDASVRPIYRRFETLTNKLLLQLQSELQHLEKELASLDSTLSPPISSQRKSKQPTLPMPPQQRNQLQWQRAEVFGLIGAKIEQYHRALTSYHSLTKMDSPPDEALAKMKRLIKTSPEDPSFLARLEDLAVLAPASTQHPAQGQLQAPRLDDRETALVTGGAILMTILAFKFVPRLVARVVLGGVIVAGMVGSGMLPEIEKERWRRQVGIYAGTVVVLALVVA